MRPPNYFFMGWGAQLSGGPISRCGHDLKLGYTALKSPSSRSWMHHKAFPILQVPENCQIGSSLVLHTHRHQIKVPLFILFSLQFIPRTIAKPIFLNHRFRPMLPMPREPSAILNWPPHWSQLSSLISEPQTLITFLSPLPHRLLPFGQASLLPAPNILLPILLGSCFWLGYSSWFLGFFLQSPLLLFKSACSFLFSEFLSGGFPGHQLWHDISCLLAYPADMYWVPPYAIHPSGARSLVLWIGSLQTCWFPFYFKFLKRRDTSVSLFCDPRGSDSPGHRVHKQ